LREFEFAQGLTARERESKQQGCGSRSRMGRLTGEVTNDARKTLTCLPLAKAWRQAGQTDTRFLDSSPKPEGGIGGEIEKEIGAVGDLRQHPVLEAELLLSKHGRGRRQYDLGALERFAQDAKAPQVHAANIADDLTVNAPREVGFGGGERNGVSNLGFLIDGHAFLRFFAGNSRPNQLKTQRFLGYFSWKCIL